MDSSNENQGVNELIERIKFNMYSLAMFPIGIIIIMVLFFISEIDYWIQIVSLTLTVIFLMLLTSYNINKAIKEYKKNR